MKKSDFDGLLQGLDETRRFAKGGKPPGLNVHIPAEADVAAIRAPPPASRKPPSPRASASPWRRYETGNKAAAAPKARRSCCWRCSGRIRGLWNGC
jgi:hypothetical protein